MGAMGAKNLKILNFAALKAEKRRQRVIGSGGRLLSNFFSITVFWPAILQNDSASSKSPTLNIGGALGYSVSTGESGGRN
jgi:hypothetical protein